MATMTRFDGVRAANEAAKGSLLHAMKNGDGGGTMYVLRPDGDTDKFTISGRRIVRQRIAGHVTLGVWIDPEDLPCVVW